MISFVASSDICNLPNQSLPPPTTTLNPKPPHLRPKPSIVRLGLKRKRSTRSTRSAREGEVALLMRLCFFAFATRRRNGFERRAHYFSLPRVIQRWGCRSRTSCRWTNCNTHNYQGTKARTSPTGTVYLPLAGSAR